ncbi:MAG: TonB-dependent receptor [Candidatus Acidiferrum sp.]
MQRMRIRGVWTVAYVMFVFLCASVQAQVNTAALSGTVLDPQGLAVAGAKITMTNPLTGVERSITADEGGRYTLVGLPPGKYSMTVDGGANFAGFEDASIVLTVGENANFDPHLQLKGAQQTLTVSSETAAVETTKTEVSATIEQRAIDNLPINGRNYINFTLTDSQVTRDNAPNTGAAPTSGLNISGQNARSNIVNVDGADATDNATNGVRSTVSQEAVQEFQIVTNSYAAEYGRASGGVVNIITRSGTNQFHGDVFGYLRDRDFQAVNPFSTVPDPAYTRVQAGIAFGGPIKKDKTFYYFSYEVTRRHETGFSSIGQNNFGLQAFDTTQVGLPFGTLQLTPQQISFLTSPATLQNEVTVPGYAAIVGQYAALAGASSGQAVSGVWPTGLTGIPGLSGFPSTCMAPPCFVPASYQTLASQEGNFPVFEGTSLWSLRIDHKLSTNNQLFLEGRVSPSTVTGIEVAGQDQPYGQNAYSRTSQQTYRDVTGIADWVSVLGPNKINDFLFQYARRGLNYNFSNGPGGEDPAVNIPGFAYFGREPYSFIKRVETRYQFADNFSWNLGTHSTKFGVDFDYIPTTATFTVNYGGVYDFGSFSGADLGFPSSLPCAGCTGGMLAVSLPPLSPVQAYGAGLPADFIQGIGSPKDSFPNKPLGAYWQDSWKIRPNLTLNYGLRYDIEFPPKFASPDPLAQEGYTILGIEKGIQTDANNVQPRIGIAWDPKGDGKTVVRAAYGLYYDHPLLGLYFLGDASDGSKSVQLAFGGTQTCTAAGDPNNLNAIPIFQGTLVNPATPQCAPSPSAALNASLGYLPNQQQFQALNFPQSLFINQNYINAGYPLGFQPFGYPQGKGFVYAYSEQANLSIERDLGKGFTLSVAYNLNEGHHINRPINANPIRGDLMLENLAAANAAGNNFGSPFLVSTDAAGNPCGVGPLGPWVDAALVNFFRPGGINPSVALAGLNASPAFASCIGLANQILKADGLNANCNPVVSLTDCVPFSDMDANYSTGSSAYNAFSANLRKRFNNHYQFLASYTLSHAIDDATDLQATLTPQDSFYPGLDRSTSTFDQRHRFVFNGVYESGKLTGDSFVTKFFSNWTLAPLVELASGRPFNIITGDDDNLQLSALTGRPNTIVNQTCVAAGFPAVPSKYSPTGVFQEPCPQAFNGTLLSLDGNLGRNSGLTPWVAFADMRFAKRIYFGERYSLELITDMFNIPNRFNVSAVNVLYTNAGQPTASYDPRQFQFAMKFRW